MKIIIDPGTYAEDINDDWKVFMFKLLEKLEKDLKCSLSIHVVSAFNHPQSKIYKIVAKYTSQYGRVQYRVLHIDSERQKYKSVYENIIVALSDVDYSNIPQCDIKIEKWSFVFLYTGGYCICNCKSDCLESCLIELDLDECQWINNEYYYR